MPIGGRKMAATPASAVSSPKQSHRRRRTGAVQTIYDVSRDVFAAAATPGFQPLPNDVARLSAFLNGLTLQDVGLDASIPYLRAAPDGGRPRVTYLHFADTPTFSFGVFCLPQSAVIPLHDHPGMTVFSKILLGSMHIQSYDWVTTPTPAGGPRATRTSAGARLAKLHTDAAFDASSETVVLYPETGGNLHRFTATAPCVVLDVMGPPYCQAEGRDCAYYGGRDKLNKYDIGAKATRGAGEDNGQYAWLKPVRRTFELDSFHLRPTIRK